MMAKDTPTTSVPGYYLHHFVYNSVDSCYCTSCFGTNRFGMVYPGRNYIVAVVYMLVVCKCNSYTEALFDRCNMIPTLGYTFGPSEIGRIVLIIIY